MKTHNGIEAGLRNNEPAVTKGYAPAVEIPRVLFCGWDVYQALTDSMKARTSPENVSDVLDTIVKMLRQQEREHTIEYENCAKF